MIFFNLFLIVFICISNHNYFRPLCPSPTMSRMHISRLFIQLEYSSELNIVYEYFFEILAFSAFTCLSLVRAFKYILNSTRYQHFSSATVKKSKIHVHMVPEYADMFLISLFVVEFDPIVFYLIYMNDIKFLFLIYQHSDRRTV